MKGLEKQFLQDSLQEQRHKKLQEVRWSDSSKPKYTKRDWNCNRICASNSVSKEILRPLNGRRSFRSRRPTEEHTKLRLNKRRKRTTNSDRRRVLPTKRSRVSSGNCGTVTMSSSRTKKGSSRRAKCNGSSPTDTGLTRRSVP